MSRGSDDFYAGAGTGRWVGISGIVAAVLIVAGVLLGGNTPEYDAPDAEWLQWFDKDSNTNAALLGALVLVVGALALIVFATGLAARFRAAGGQRGNAALIAGAGVACGVCFIVGGILANAIAAAIAFDSDYPIPAPDVAKALEQAGIGIVLVGAGWAAALLVAVVSFSARRTGQLPSWLTAAGMVVAVLLLASIIFVPLVLLPLWALVTGIVLLREGPASSVSPGPAAMR